MFQFLFKIGVSKIFFYIKKIFEVNTYWEKGNVLEFNVGLLIKLLVIDPRFKINYNIIIYKIENEPTITGIKFFRWILDLILNSK